MNNPTDIHPAARSLIKGNVRRLIRQHGFGFSEEEDLCQELAIVAHVAERQYDPARSAPATYFARVLSNKVIDLGLWQHRKRRAKRLERPLEAAMYLLDLDDPTEALQLRIDVREALAELPARDQAVAAGMKEMNLSAAARDAGLTREQGRRAKRRITNHLTRRGLKP